MYVTALKQHIFRSIKLMMKFGA